MLEESKGVIKGVTEREPEVRGRSRASKGHRRDELGSQRRGGTNSVSEEFLHLTQLAVPESGMRLFHFPL